MSQATDAKVQQTSQGARHRGSTATYGTAQQPPTTQRQHSQRHSTAATNDTEAAQPPMAQHGPASGNRQHRNESTYRKVVTPQIGTERLGPTDWFAAGTGRRLASWEPSAGVMQTATEKRPERLGRLARENVRENERMREIDRKAERQKK